ncbi:MAG: FAD:protein FMN transferase [Chitinophagaceae bacterium]
MRLIIISNSLAKMKLIFLTVVTFLLFINCKQQDDKIMKLAGNAQGTTWQMSWLSNNHSDYKEAIDSIFRRIDSSLSTYVPASIISRINKNDTAVIADDHFIKVFNGSIEVSEKTNGLFDITVAPVINAWGFGFTKKANVDSAMIDSLLDFVGYKMVRLEGSKLVKEKPPSMLDCNAIAQGYTVDVLASFLGSKGITNYLVELGGEVKAKGKKNNDDYWTVGIDKPNEIPTDGRPLKAIIKLKDRALATSGNYRRFYVEDGKKYAHIIDPHTGYPAKHNLVSATVLAGDCMTADAYATAFMVMGVERAKQFLSAHKELQLEVFFIYDENGAWKTYSSQTLKERIEELP